MATLRSVSFRWGGPLCTFKPSISIAARAASGSASLWIASSSLLKVPSSRFLWRSGAWSRGSRSFPAFVAPFCFKSCGGRSLVFMPNSGRAEWNHPFTPWNIDEPPFIQRRCNYDAASMLDRQQSLLLAACLPCLFVPGYFWLLVHWILSRLCENGDLAVA